MLRKNGRQIREKKEQVAPISVQVFLFHEEQA
jgi:hypothetical protein